LGGDHLRRFLRRAGADLRVAGERDAPLRRRLRVHEPADPAGGPFIGWLESFTLVFASLAIVAFEVPIVLRNLQITGRIVGIGTGWGFFEDDNKWFAKGGVITGVPGFIGALLVLGVIFAIVGSRRAGCTASSPGWPRSACSARS
jgi:hypothetical protein